MEFTFIHLHIGPVNFSILLPPLKYFFAKELNANLENGAVCHSKVLINMNHTFTSFLLTLFGKRFMHGDFLAKMFLF